MGKIPCPCCGQPTSRSGVCLNALAAAAAAVVDARERLHRIPGSDIGRLRLAHVALERAKDREAELREKLSPGPGECVDREAALGCSYPRETLPGSAVSPLRIQPTDADTALGAQVLLAELTLNATAFAASSSQSKAAEAITADSSANALWSDEERFG